jgi:hypothetical protein
MTLTRRTEPTYRLRVTLEEIEPPIWRMLLVRSSESLHRLHQILQVAMGWTNSHLYVFEAGGHAYGDVNPEWEVENSKRMLIHALLPRSGAGFVYRYDMGDDWCHYIRLEDVLGSAEELGRTLPYCEDGARACPPEDCGGPPGYDDLLAAMKNPVDEEAKYLVEWAGDFDPERFDRARVNRQLRRFAATTSAPSRKRVRGSEMQLILERIDDLMAGHPLFVEPIHKHAHQLIRKFANLSPGTLSRAQRAETWAAGAVYRAFQNFNGVQRPTLDDVAAIFHVSPATVSQRGLALRPYASRPSALDSITADLEQQRRTPHERKDAPAQPKSGERPQLRLL